MMSKVGVNMLYDSDITRLREVLDEMQRGDSSDGGRVALAFSHQIEDTIALDLALRAGIDRDYLEVFTLDTKKLFNESLDYQAEVERFFDIEIMPYSARDSQILMLENELGEWGIRESIEKRKYCCAVRKIEPLKVALSGKIAWISGIRIAQSITRAQTQLIEDDANFALKKINPLFDWDDSKMWEYAKSRNLPINALYSQGFSSIGCSVCTRAIKEGEDIRAGRWWWENPDHKECGLHRR